MELQSVCGKAIVFSGLGRVETAPFEVQSPNSGECLVETEISLVSPGTELRCLAGAQPNSLPFPFIPGYVTLGTVIATGPDVRIPIGARVLCDGTRRCPIGIEWGGHVSHALTPQELAIPIPDDLGFEQAAVAKLAAIAMRGLKVSNLVAGESVCVIGLGPIGMLSARLFQCYGAHVLAIDTDPRRVQMATSAGLTASVAEHGIANAVFDHFGGGSEIVVDATGSPKVLREAIDAARKLPWSPPYPHGARLVIQGSYPGDFGVPYQEAFEKELHIILPRDAHRADKMECLDLIASGQLRVDDFLTTVASPEDAQRVYDQVGNKEAYTALFRWK